MPGVGRLQATLINAGNPTIFILAAELGLTSTGAVALAVAAAIPETIAHGTLSRQGEKGETRIGHPASTLIVGAAASQQDSEWVVTKAIMSRSARRLMEGWVKVPADTLDQRL